MADADELGRRLAAVAVSDSDSANNNLFQVMRAVEDAEATIRQQVSYPITISFFIFLPPPPPPHSLSLSLSLSWRRTAASRTSSCSRRESLTDS